MYIKFQKPYPLAAVLLLACLHLGDVWAQSTGQPVELVYQSSFQSYQRYSPSPPPSWKQANDTVKDIGGWRTYAKENTQDQDAKPSAPAHSHGAHQ